MEWNRCNALINHSQAAMDAALRHGGEVALKRLLRHDGRCRRQPVPGKSRCSLHGGRSTGPATGGGMANTVAAMKAGRARWLAELKAAGVPVPFGRKKGGRNRPRADREQAAIGTAAQREHRRIARQARQDRRVRREAKRQERKELAELEHRRQASQRGLPFWPDDVPPPAPEHRHVPLDWGTAPAQPDLTGQDGVLDLLEANLALLREHGIKTSKADIADWARAERMFIERIDQLPPETVERAIRLFRRVESFCDRGEARDMRRRDRLERAYEEWQARERTAAMIRGVRERGERLRAFTASPDWTSG